MGILFSRFRTKPSTKELLEELEKEIEALEEYKRSTELQQKTVIRSLIIYSVLIYILVAGVFLFYSFPVTTRDRVIYAIPLLVFPLLLYILKKFLHWYFLQKLRNNDENLLELKKRKRSLLDFAMETETYKVVKELLERYDPAYHKRIFEARPAIEAAPASTPLKGSFADMDLRRRNVSFKVHPTQPIPMGAPDPKFKINPVPAAVRAPIPAPMPRPVLPRERTLIDKLVDYLVGDGPSNRYALICRQCQSHNGMALKEEFEFIAFKCCYCFHWNPPRNQHPPPPRLPPVPSAPPAIMQGSASEVSSSSDETEIENLSDTEHTANKKDTGVSHRLSSSSENEIQAKLEEDKPFSSPSSDSLSSRYSSVSANS